ncbi:hypothetical protein [Leucobacter chinensis]|uniref:hypothetical protein n=1 Tax=Leucobacter chinensis TaxID=2851010 RepID=UPI001C21BF9E|nr:hypothetical protein [Leucobacter chinensis]
MNITPNDDQQPLETEGFETMPLETNAFDPQPGSAQAGVTPPPPAQPQPAPAASQPTAPAPTPAPAPQPPAKSRPRSGPIVWGTLMLAFCAWVTQRALFPDIVQTGLWIALTVLGLGALLLIVGVSVAMRGKRSPEAPTSARHER